MNNFSSIFTRLREQRGLSIKQIASFTGASTKDVKKWEAGTSLPTDQKIVAALEGLLGKDISNTRMGILVRRRCDSPLTCRTSTLRIGHYN